MIITEVLLSLMFLELGAIALLFGELRALRTENLVLRAELEWKAWHDVRRGEVA